MNGRDSSSDCRWPVTVELRGAGATKGGLVKPVDVLTAAAEICPSLDVGLERVTGEALGGKGFLRTVDEGPVIGLLPCVAVVVVVIDVGGCGIGPP